MIAPREHTTRAKLLDMLSGGREGIEFEELVTAAGDGRAPAEPNRSGYFSFSASSSGSTCGSANAEAAPAPAVLPTSTVDRGGGTEERFHSTCSAAAGRSAAPARSCDIVFAPLMRSIAAPCSPRSERALQGPEISGAGSCSCGGGTAAHPVRRAAAVVATNAKQRCSAPRISEQRTSPMYRNVATASSPSATIRTVMTDSADRTVTRRRH